MIRAIIQPVRRRRALLARSGFTLMELLVVMGIIGVLGAITAVAYRAVAKDAKMSSAKNTVMAVLDNARGLAMRNNEIVLVAFRPRIDGNKQYVEAILAKWTRQSVRYTVTFSPQPAIQVTDRFVPIAGITPRRLPQGIHVAGPFYGGGFDAGWVTLSHLSTIAQNTQGEAAGSIIGVMYSPDGRAIMQNATSDSQRIWVDFNNDGLHQWNSVSAAPIDYSTPQTFSPAQQDNFFLHFFDKDEPHISLVPYLAVYDDDAVRELYDPNRWSFPGDPNAYTNRPTDYAEYLTNNADRIHFNRYTGVAMR